MRNLKLSVVFALLAAGLGLAASVSFGTTDFAKKEHKACTFCHTKLGSKELNDMGKCYQTNKHSLEGCESKEKAKPAAKP